MEKFLIIIYIFLAFNLIVNACLIYFLSLLSNRFNLERNIDKLKHEKDVLLHDINTFERDIFCLNYRKKDLMSDICLLEDIKNKKSKKERKKK